MSVGPPRIQSKCNCNDDILCSSCKRESWNSPDGYFCGIAHDHPLCFYFYVMLLKFSPVIAATERPKVGFRVKQVVAQITREVPPESSTLVEISLHKMSTGGGGPLSCLIITTFALTFFATLVKTQEADVQCFDVTGDFVLSWAKVGFGASLAKYFVNATTISNSQW